MSERTKLIEPHSWYPTADHASITFHSSPFGQLSNGITYKSNKNNNQEEEKFYDTKVLMRSRTSKDR
jgi:hypothetical protein